MLPLIILILIPLATPSKISIITTKNVSIPLNDPDLWYDLSKFGEFDRICAEGSYLLYSSPDFQSAKDSISIVTGKGECFKTEDKFLSIQPLSNLTLFPGRDFNGMGWTMGGPPPKSKSLITTTTQKYTLHLLNAEPVCIQPSPGKFIRSPICFVSKLVDGVKVKSSGILKITHGCRGEIFKIQFCMDAQSFYGVRRIQEIAHKIIGRQAEEETKKPGKEDMIQGCPKPIDISTILDKEGMSLIETRITKNLESNVNLFWPKNISNVWKLELLERVFSVAMGSCEIVDDGFLQVVREIFVYLWENKRNASNYVIQENMWHALNNQMVECNLAVRSDFRDIAEISLHQYNSIPLPRNAPGLIDPMYLRAPTYDFIIDTVWLLANHAASTCHHALRFVTNFWPNFITVFQEVYLKELKEQWSNPGLLANAYKYILGGYGIEKMYNKMGICASVSLGLVDNLDSFGRWVDAVNYV